MTYQQALKRIAPSFSGGQARDYYGKIERIKSFFADHGNPQKKLKIVLVGGTVGKGSTCHYIARMLGQRYKVGLTVSPHLQSPRERIQINEKLISKRLFADLVSGNFALKKKLNLTYPEFLLGLAILHFAKNHCDYAVVEVGLGGRYDPANSLDAIIVVITNIGSDHRCKLGKKPIQRLREKYAITRSGVPLITGVDQPKLRNWVRQRSKLDAVPVHFVTLASPDFRIIDLALAKYVLKVLGVDKLEKVDIGVPGRFERIKKNLIIDAAHNRDGLIALKRLLNKKGISHELIRTAPGLDDQRINDFLAKVKDALIKRDNTVVATGSIFAAGKLRDIYKPID